MKVEGADKVSGEQDVFDLRNGTVFRDTDGDICILIRKEDADGEERALVFVCEGNYSYTVSDRNGGDFRKTKDVYLNATLYLQGGPEK